MFGDPSKFHHFVVITANPVGRSFLEMMNSEWHLVSWSAFLVLRNPSLECGLRIDTIEGQEATESDMLVTLVKRTLQDR